MELWPSDQHQGRDQAVPTRRVEESVESKFERQGEEGHCLTSHRLRPQHRPHLLALRQVDIDLDRRRFRPLRREEGRLPGQGVRHQIQI